MKLSQIHFVFCAVNYVVQFDFEAALERDPMTKLRRYVDRAGLRLVDLFRQFDKDNSMTVSKEELMLGVQVLRRMYIIQN